MKKSKTTYLQTPVKKWQQMSPMEDQLAIVQSDISEQEQPELFHSLVGQSPHGYSHISILTPTSFSNEQSESQQMAGEEIEESMEQQSPKTVSEMKIQQKKQEKINLLKQVDTNRKGCSCKNSKCEKKYCDCLRMGLVCAEGTCSCENCNNKQEKQIHHQNNKKQTQQISIKGCHCKKSRCLKKYCECHSGGRKCGPLCECVQCYNRDENLPPENQILRRLRFYDQKEFIY